VTEWCNLSYEQLQTIAMVLLS